MARITVEDCLGNVENRFHLVLIASKRARQLAMTAADAVVEWDNDKATVVALREIAKGYVDLAEQEENRVKGLQDEIELHPVNQVDVEEKE